MMIIIENVWKNESILHPFMFGNNVAWFHPFPKKKNEILLHHCKHLPSSEINCRVFFRFPEYIWWFFFLFWTSLFDLYTKLWMITMMMIDEIGRQKKKIRMMMWNWNKKKNETFLSLSLFWCHRCWQIVLFVFPWIFHCKHYDYDDDTKWYPLTWSGNI